MTRKEKALELHQKGYNCAQSVTCAYCDMAGIDQETMFIVTEGLGLGMGAMLGTCGAVSGACIIAGAMNSSANLEAPDSKKSTYELTAAITKKFQEKNSTLTCKVLKGIDTGTVLRPCSGCIEDACDILEEVLPALKEEI